jgi:hypothetical protein
MNEKRCFQQIDRRRFIGGLTGTTIGWLAAGISRAQVGADALLVIAYEDAGRPVASDFIGLSYESAILAAGNYFTPDNKSVLGLIRSLGENGVIRIGGNTSEFTEWRVEAKPGTSGSFVITPASIDRLAATLSILGWKLIYGLNLARGTPAEAAEEAAYVSRLVGPNLLAFQIGNEPDKFGRWSWTAPRFKTYNVARFVAEWRTFHAAVRARIPDAHFAGPDVAGETDWVAPLAEGHPEGLVLLTRHYYADGPAGAPHVTLAKLLGSDGQIAPVLEKLEYYSRSYRLPYRIVEANSIYNEGQPGVSDTLGAALWGLELMFEAAAASAAGVNFHGGVHNRQASDDKAYTPIARSASGGYRAQPLFYGMKMFAQAARGALIPTRLVSDRSDLSAFAVRSAEGNLRVCLINKDFSRSARVRIDPGRDFDASSVMRLSGPAADATADITLGGSSVDPFGGWSPTTSEAAHPVGREIAVDVPAASAALVLMK